MNMIRTMGGSIGVAVTSAILHSTLHADLAKFLPEGQVNSLTDSLSLLSTLSQSDIAYVRQIFGRSYNEQFRAMLVFATLNVLVSLLITVLRRRQIAKPKQSEV